MVHARHRDAPDRGAAAVEFALVLPLLFVILFGVVEYGYNLFQMQAAQSTIRETARRVALGIDSCDDIDGIVTRAARNNGFGIDPLVLAAKTRLTVESPPGTTTVPPGPQRGDTAVMSLEYAPTLDFPLIPFPSKITRDAGVVIEDVGKMQERSC
jgi:Flp pilus assembly protein TadG